MNHLLPQVSQISTPNLSYLYPLLVSILIISCANFESLNKMQEERVLLLQKVSEVSLAPQLGKNLTTNSLLFTK